jgi:hypothetical protein
MALSINLTVVVQMVHFFIAYYLLNYFFLKPGYKIVAAEAYRSKQLKSRIIARQELIAHKQSYKVSRWKLFADFFAKQKPQMGPEYAPSSTSLPRMSTPEIPQKELMAVAKTIADALASKVQS